MTRFLLVFTLLTLAVPTMTEPAAQSSGTNPAPDPNGPQPIRTTADTVTNLLEPVGPGNGTRQVNQLSLGTTEAAVTDLGSTVAPEDDKEISQYDERAKLWKCSNKKKRPMCFVGSNCIEGEERGNHTNFVMLNASIVSAMRRGGMDDSAIERIEGCNVAATLKKSYDGYYLGDLTCRPFCEVTEEMRSISQVNNVSYICWSATILFNRVKKSADLSQCYKKKPSSICFVGDACLEGSKLYEHEHIVWLSLENKAKFTAKKAAEDGCNVAVVLIRQKPGTYSLEYHTTPDYHRMIFTRFPPGPPRVGRRVYIKDGTLLCDPACEFTRTEGEIDQNYWSGEIHYKTMSIAEAEEHARNPLAIHADSEEMDGEPESKIALIFGVCAATFVVCIAAVVVVVIVIQRGQEKENRRRVAVIEAAAAKNNDQSRKGAVKAREVEEPLMPSSPLKLEGPATEPVSESVKNREGEF